MRDNAKIFFVRRGEGMVRSVPTLVAFVPLEHGEIVHPHKAEVFRGVAGLFENAVAVGVFLGEGQAQQSG